MSRLVSLYKHTLRLYPKDYYNHYAEPMAQTLEDMLEDQPSESGKRYVWLRTIANVPFAASYQYIEIGGTMMKQTPNYVKQGIALNTLLLVPFFILIPLNMIHPLPMSWKGIGYTGVFILPVIAFVVGAVTLAWWLFAADSRIHSIRSFLKRLGSNWPLFAAPVIALSIITFAFGHDSVHCVVNNPIQAMSNIPQTIECIVRG